MKILIILASILLSISALGQTYNTNLETKIWEVCIKPACNPGGVGTPTKIINSYLTKGWMTGTLELGIYGPAWSNILDVQKVGATNANYFEAELDVYIPKITADSANALEYDIFIFDDPYEFMFGSQCEPKGVWWIWNQMIHHWVPTTIACTLTTGWHHIQWFVHRVPNDLNCTGYPCEYYDTLGVDYKYTILNTTEPSGPLPKGWNNNSGIQLQLDINGSGVGLTEYAKHINLIQTP